MSPLFQASGTVGEALQKPPTSTEGAATPNLGEPPVPPLAQISHDEWMTAVRRVQKKYKAVEKLWFSLTPADFKKYNPRKGAAIKIAFTDLFGDFETAQPELAKFLGLRGFQLPKSIPLLMDALRVWAGFKLKFGTVPGVTADELKAAQRRAEASIGKPFRDDPALCSMMAGLVKYRYTQGKEGVELTSGQADVIKAWAVMLALSFAVDRAKGCPVTPTSKPVTPAD
jgi:hypothetical protein